MARWPILSRCFSIVTPGASIGITSAVSPLWPWVRSVETKQTIQDAWPAFVMNILEPLTTYSSPRLVAVVWIPETSDPAPGLREPEAAEDRRVDERPEPLLLLLLGAGDQDRRRSRARSSVIEVPIPEHPQ